MSPPGEESGAPHGIGLAPPPRGAAATDPGAPPAAHRGPNPYAGPRSLRYGEPIYGRDRETKELLDLLIAERIVLLHSPSGAGKTSLIEAALRPALKKEDFNVLPVIRLGRTPAGVNGTNPYILSTLLSLEEGVPKELALPARELAGMDLDAYLKRREQRQPGRLDTVLVFDQFEEILTLHVLHGEMRRKFFEQVSIALRAPHRWALFSMREDHLGALLDPYADVIPTRFKNTYRLDLLTHESAKAAIREPARAQGVVITPEAVDKLVNDLRQVAVWNPETNTTERKPGRYVEPVQLQVVCYRLWEKPDPDSPQEINAEEIEGLKDVDKVLADFYAANIERIGRENGGCEREIRKWFDRTLITEGGIRAQVQKESDGSRGFPNEVIDQLQDVHLIRGEDRRGITWLELSHDRLVKPIHENNAEWRAKHLNVLQRAAEEWLRLGRPENLLLARRDLQEAKSFASNPGVKLLPLEEEFLKESQRHFWDNFRQASIYLIPLFLALSVFALMQANKAKKHRMALQTATQSLNLLEERLDLALLLAQHSMGSAPEFADAQSALFAAVLHNPRLLKFHHEHEEPVSAIAVSPDGKTMVSGDYSGRILFRDLVDGKTVPRKDDLGRPTKVAGDSIRSLAFSPGGGTLAVASKDGSLKLLNPETGETRVLIEAPAGSSGGEPADIWSVAYDRGTSLLVVGAGSRGVQAWETAGIWEGEARVANPVWEEQVKAGNKVLSIRAAALSGDGRYLAAGGEEGIIRIWQRQEAPGTWQSQGLLEIPAKPDVKVTPRVNALAFKPDTVPPVLAAGTREYYPGEESSKGGFYLFNITSREMKSAPPHEGGQVTALAFDPKGDQIATASYDGTLHLWKLPVPDPGSGIPDPEPVGEPFKGHSNWVLSLAFWRYPDTRGTARLASGGIDKKLILWHPDRFVPVDPQRKEKKRKNPEPKSESFQYAFSPDGRYQASGYHSGKILVSYRHPDAPLSKPQNLIEEVPPGHPSPVREIAFSKDSSCMVVCRGEKNRQKSNVWIYDLSATEATLRCKLEIDEPVATVAMGPDNACLAAGTASDNKGSAGKLLFYGDTRAKKPVRQELDRFLSREGTAVSLATLDFSPDGKRIAGAGDSHFFAVWDVESGKMQRIPPDDQRGDEHQGSVRSVIFSPDKSRDLVATTSGDNTAALWNVKECKRIGSPLTGHSAEVIHAVFSPKGDLLASASEDMSVLLWDVKSQRRLGPPLHGHLDKVRALNFSEKDSKLSLYSGSYVNGPADTQHWDLDPKSWEAQCKERANRNFTRSEWKAYIGENEPYELIWRDLGEPKE